MFNIQKHTFVLALLLPLTFAAIAPNATMGQTDVSSSVIRKTKSFLETRTTGKYILEFLHMGGTYKSHTLNRVTGVNDSLGKTVSGKFAVIYDFVWDANGKGHTRVAFYCDKQGTITGIKVLYYDAYVNTPFTFAEGAIHVVGQLVIEAFRDQMSSSERRTAESLVRSADAKGLLTLGLALRQSMNIR